MMYSADEQAVFSRCIALYSANEQEGRFVYSCYIQRCIQQVYHSIDILFQGTEEHLSKGKRLGSMGEGAGVGVAVP